MGFSNINEYVTCGHSDRTSDVIASLIIDDINHHDQFDGHAAIEVFMAHTKIIVSGEVVTSLVIDDNYLKDVVRRAFDICGLIPEVRKYWGRDQVALLEDIEIENLISAQSPDISLGTTSCSQDTGWNDQTIAFSSSDNTTDNNVGYSYKLAYGIGEFLFKESRESILNGGPIIMGSDIKVLVSLHCDDENGMIPSYIEGITVAIPHTSDQDVEVFNHTIISMIKNYISSNFSDLYEHSENIKWIVNGTGRFTVWSMISDCSMTGRKISVNHPSAGPVHSCKMIGGGSQIKCAHASDLLLPLYARFISNVIVRSGLSSYCVVGLSSSIGQRSLGSCFIWADFKLDSKQVECVKEFFNSKDVSPRSLIQMFGLFNSDFSFSDCVIHNFYGDSKHSQTWEDPHLIDQWSQELVKYISVVH